MRCTLPPSHLAWPRSRLDTWNRPISDTRMIQLARRDWTKRGLPCHTKGTVRVGVAGVAGVGVDHRPSVSPGGRTPSPSRGTGRGAREARAGRTGLETDCPGTQGGVDHHGRGVVSHVAIRTPDRATSRVRLSSIHSRLGPAACSLAAAAYAGVACDAPASLDTPELPFVLVVAVWPWMLGTLAVKTSLPQEEMEASITSSPPPAPRPGPAPGPPAPPSYPPPPG